MLRLIWTISVHLRTFMRRYTPTNTALDALRSRHGLKWGIPAMLIAIPYLSGASILTSLIDGGAPRWLYAVTLVLIWDALKFIIMGPVSLVMLLRVRATESRQRRALRRPVGPLVRL
ncbi:sulfate permease [Acidipropionibacterium jensenii]|uniref:sulfate permease n=1 Tax=Acidipropionibacterium jensenii TaxID=1749 RepID=UPI00214C71B0|nr:sulfate permease [Acidipropionibacterium jensenii]